MPVGDIIHEIGLLIDGPNGPLLKPDKGAPGNSSHRAGFPGWSATKCM